MPPILFLSLRYVRRKPCTNFEPTLTMSLNRQKQDPTWPTSPRSSIGCLQYYFQAYITFDTNRTPILHQELHYLQTDWTELPLDHRHQGVPSSASKTISIPMVCSVQTMHLSHTDTNTISKRLKRASTRPTSLTSSIGCVQNYLWAYGTFSANSAPILHQD
jgi:hypothetical protein